MSEHVTLCGRKGNLLAAAFVLSLLAAVFVPVIIHEARPCLVAQHALPGTVLSCQAGRSDGRGTVEVQARSPADNATADVLLFKKSAPVLEREPVAVDVVPAASSVVAAGARELLELALLPGSVLTLRVAANTTENVTLLVLTPEDALHMRYVEPFAWVHRYHGPANRTFVLAVEHTHHKQQQQQHPGSSSGGDVNLVSSSGSGAAETPLAVVPVQWVLVLDNSAGQAGLAANYTVACRCVRWNATSAAQHCVATPSQRCSVAVAAGDTLAVSVPPGSRAPFLLVGGLHWSTAVTSLWTVLLVCVCAFLGVFIIQCAQRSLAAEPKDS